ncbi:MULTISPECIES: SDR family NAD(P)-dependent oxidoreductase [Lelliottia]|uniref:3-oxoacyl-ACP reductase n=1 Tax=Lelliottia aquatilis TaxID=2080838 RepID=A0ABX5A6P0_9ENTR|nr:MULTISPECIES: SDR family oxidoreductase [Lelliottia]MBL5882157.1 SDR family oxidoreductase [Lelliottia aquatilis]NTZ44974.1 SDR family oxidoreductase [Lelliottia aquatilis]POZ28808.1 3-oxoacyl-ACP reductase [Lelliottia aquatilis]POZ33538.1 3-oxoacyl-ACP reductase [Lelliottia aquatilis]POZ34072.1 3-oxoacyl-ACP reductase [Lelliottia sp. 7254-16]
MTLPQTPSFALRGKRALVTGGSKGLGFASAVALAQAGAQVWIAARDPLTLEHAAALAGESGLTLHPLALDITDSASVESALGQLPAFDILVNSAGLARHEPFLTVSEDNFDAVMTLNLRATFFISQRVAQRMRDEGIAGSIIHVSSQMGHVGGPNRSVYCASKFALEGLSKTMALELGDAGIRVNTICPTFIETELSRQSLDNPDFRRYVLENIKLRRLGRVEDVMGPVVFLASDAAAMITGTALLVDGGWTAT